MHGQAQRLIRKQGVEYTVHNASGGGGRDTPDYSGDDGTLVGVLEQRSRPRRDADSSGTEIVSDLEIRAVVDSALTIRESENTDDYPTRLEHPDGQTYEVLASFPEDSGVTVFSVVRV
jgi:hypothetical protein